MKGLKRRRSRTGVGKEGRKARRIEKVELGRLEGEATGACRDGDSPDDCETPWGRGMSAVWPGRMRAAPWPTPAPETHRETVC